MCVVGYMCLWKPNSGLLFPDGAPKQGPQRYYISLFPIHKENPIRCKNISKFIIPYLYEAQHVSRDTLLIIRSLKLHWQPLVFHTWKVVGRVDGGRCQAHCARQHPPTTRPNNLPRMKNQGLPVQF